MFFLLIDPRHRRKPISLEMICEFIVRLHDWRNAPAALGSESRAAVLVGQANFLRGRRRNSPAIGVALRQLALRASMREMAREFSGWRSSSERAVLSHNIAANKAATSSSVEVDDVIAVAESASGLSPSWAESMATISTYLTETESAIEILMKRQRPNIQAEYRRFLRLTQAKRRSFRPKQGLVAIPRFMPSRSTRE